jgi:hypothetical protein
MRILFVASLHHPEALAEAVAKTPAGQAPPLFPPSMAQHFWEKALLRRGHVLEVFFRNEPAFGGGIKSHRHTNRITPGKVLGALARRLPTLNPDYRLRNKRLIEKAKAFAPDVLWLIGDNTIIYPETIAQIKAEHGCKVVYASGTSPIVFGHQMELRAAPLYDLVLVNDYYHGIQWLELGAGQMQCLPIAAIDPEFHHPYALTEAEQAAYQCEIAFVGTLLPDHLYSERVKALSALTEFDLGIWSVHEVPAHLKPALRGGALGETMMRIMSAAKICINPHGNFMRYGGNQRLFEASAAGILQITDNLPGIPEWFTPGENILVYTDAADLKAQVSHYLHDEAARLALAEKARQHVYTHHTYDNRVQQVEVLLAALK